MATTSAPTVASMQVIPVDMAEVEKAHQLYKQHGLGDRDDAVAMQYLIPGLTFDPKQPCMLR